MMIKQLTWCQKHQDEIVNKANKLYTIICNNKASYNLRKRCCNFPKLETVLKKYLSKSSEIHKEHTAEAPNTKRSPLSRAQLLNSAKIIAEKSARQSNAPKKNHNLE